MSGKEYDVSGLWDDITHALLQHHRFVDMCYLNNLLLFVSVQTIIFLVKPLYF